MIKGVIATQELINQMKPFMRESDNRETLASHGIEAQKALQLAFQMSYLCWIGLYNNNPMIAFGVLSKTILGNVGIPWMLATDMIDKSISKKALGRRSKYYITKMFEPYDLLENYVDVRNEIAIKWLGWCGFSFEEPVKYGINGELFRRFYMKREA